MPSIIQMLDNKNNRKSDFEDLAEQMFQQVAEKEHDEETDLKAHVDACAKRFKLLTILDLHNLGEIRKLKKWVFIGTFFVVFGKYIISLIISFVKGMSVMDALQLFLSL